MRKTGRPERRLPGQPCVQLPSKGRRERTIELGGELHEQVVRMLPVVNAVTIALLASGEKIGIAASRDSDRLEADHRTKAESSLRERPASGEHDPIDAAPLGGAAVFGSRFVQK